jgi:preprotein translocase subunit SecG
MALILVIAGLVFMLAGLVLIIKPPETADAQALGIGDDTKSILEAIAALLKDFNEQFRIGLAVMFFGLALVAGGIFVDTHNAANDAKDAKQAVAKT